MPANSWFSFGPALVLLLAHDTNPTDLAIRSLAILLLALAAQFACDFAANAVRERLCGGIGIRELLGEVREVYLIDARARPARAG